LQQVTDRWSNRITLTDERWQHIIEWHPELEGFEDDVLDTIRKGRRRQDPIDPHKYKYLYPVEDLPFGLTHIVVVVRIAARKFVLRPMALIGKAVSNDDAKRSSIPL
jgi:hypothetical protein